MPPRLRFEVEDLIVAKDTSTLGHWLQDTSLVKRAYAAEGFIRLTWSGVEMSKQTADVVESIKASQIKILTCHGCPIGMEPINSAMATFLKLKKREHKRQKS